MANNVRKSDALIKNLCGEQRYYGDWVESCLFSDYKVVNSSVENLPSITNTDGLKGYNKQPVKQVNNFCVKVVNHVTKRKYDISYQFTKNTTGVISSEKWSLTCDSSDDVILSKINIVYKVSSTRMVNGSSVVIYTDYPVYEYGNRAIASANSNEHVVHYSSNRSSTYNSFSKFHAKDLWYEFTTTKGTVITLKVPATSPDLTPTLTTHLGNIFGSDDVMPNRYSEIPDGNDYETDLFDVTLTKKPDIIAKDFAYVVSRNKMPKMMPSNKKTAPWYVESWAVKKVDDNEAATSSRYSLIGGKVTTIPIVSTKLYVMKGTDWVLCGRMAHTPKNTGGTTIRYSIAKGDSRDVNISPYDFPHDDSEYMATQYKFELTLKDGNTITMLKNADVVTVDASSITPTYNTHLVDRVDWYLTEYNVRAYYYAGAGEPTRYVCDFVNKDGTTSKRDRTIYVVDRYMDWTTNMRDGTKDIVGPYRYIDAYMVYDALPSMKKQKEALELHEFCYGVSDDGTKWTTTPYTNTKDVTSYGYRAKTIFVHFNDFSNYGADIGKPSKHYDIASLVRYFSDMYKKGITAESVNNYLSYKTEVITTVAELYASYYDPSTDDYFIFNSANNKNSSKFEATTSITTPLSLLRRKRHEFSDYASDWVVNGSNKSLVVVDKNGANVTIKTLCSPLSSSNDVRKYPSARDIMFDYTTYTDSIVKTPNVVGTMPNGTVRVLPVIQQKLDELGYESDDSIDTITETTTGIRTGNV